MLLLHVVIVQGGQTTEVPDAPRTGRPHNPRYQVEILLSELLSGAFFVMQLICVNLRIKQLSRDCVIVSAINVSI